MNTGTLYGVGIGPGDPKLMTFRAAELIRDNEIIALPGESRRNRGIPDRRADSRRIKTENISGTADADDKRQGIVGKKS